MYDRDQIMDIDDLTNYSMALSPYNQPAFIYNITENSPI